MNASIKPLAAVLLLSATLSMALGAQHICAGTRSKPSYVEPNSLESENGRIRIKVAAYFELINQTGEYFPLEFTEVAHYQDKNPIYSSISLKDGNCAVLDLFLTEKPDEDTHQVNLLQLFLRDPNELRYTCRNYNLGIEFKRGEQYSLKEPLVVTCHKTLSGPAHAEIVFQNLEIELLNWTGQEDEHKALETS